jgi:dihydroneopterin aldolase
MTSHNEAIMQLLLANQGATSLFLEDIIREIDIGIHDHEIGVLQRVRFDIYAMIGGALPTKSDEIDDVLNYEYLIDILDQVLAANRVALLETLADRILDLIMKPTAVDAASVVITKLDVLDGDGRLGCSMTRMK